ncbi:AI-2E family transporter [Actinocorallia longicatena]|uniref:AI-2E family transporter n=1 Tax=Actinocorallia longicatena TaxID=111803 RepID=A0ABP6Q906_9ACTN
MVRGRISDGLLLLVGGAAAVVCLGGLRSVSSISGPFFLALVLTVAATPLRVALIRRGAPGWASALLPLLAVLAGLGATAGALAFSVARLATVLPEYQDDFAELTRRASEFLTARGVGQAQATAALSGLDPSRLASLLQDFLTGLLGALSAGLLIVVLLYAMSIDAVGLHRALNRLEGPRPRLVTALRRYSTDTYRYLLVSTVFGLIVAVLDTIALAVLDVPLPVLWGLLAFITNYIPNVGFVIGLVPPALLALLDSGPETMAWVIAVYCVLNFVIQSLIQPKFVGDAAGLSVTITMVSLAVWTFVLGPVGAILAVPLTLLARTLLLDHDPEKAWVGPLLSAD